ncbi:MAG: hypothetical protein MUE73_06175 [Planctomycetes bacterium]|jgi:hypothetical protein|nr:hypothetical protein [Planctomycetota bacterium]
MPILALMFAPFPERAAGSRDAAAGRQTKLPFYTESRFPAETGGEFRRRCYPPGFAREAMYEELKDRMKDLRGRLDHAMESL